MSRSSEGQNYNDACLWKGRDRINTVCEYEVKQLTNEKVIRGKRNFNAKSRRRGFTNLQAEFFLRCRLCLKGRNTSLQTDSVLLLRYSMYFKAYKTIESTAPCVWIGWLVML